MVRKEYLEQIAYIVYKLEDMPETIQLCEARALLREALDKLEFHNKIMAIESKII